MAPQLTYHACYCGESVLEWRVNRPPVMDWLRRHVAVLQRTRRAHTCSMCRAHRAVSVMRDVGTCVGALVRTRRHGGEAGGQAPCELAPSRRTARKLRRMAASGPAKHAVCVHQPRATSLSIDAYIHAIGTEQSHQQLLQSEWRASEFQLPLSQAFSPAPLQVSFDFTTLPLYPVPVLRVLVSAYVQRLTLPTDSVLLAHCRRVLRHRIPRPSTPSG